MQMLTLLSPEKLYLRHTSVAGETKTRLLHVEFALHLVNKIHWIFPLHLRFAPFIKWWMKIVNSKWKRKFSILHSIRPRILATNSYDNNNEFIYSYIWSGASSITNYSTVSESILCMSIIKPSPVKLSVTIWQVLSASHVYFYYWIIGQET